MAGHVDLDLAQPQLGAGVLGGLARRARSLRMRRTSSRGLKGLVT